MSNEMHEAEIRGLRQLAAEYGPFTTSASTRSVWAWTPEGSTTTWALYTNGHLLLARPTTEAGELEKCPLPVDSIIQQAIEAQCTPRGGELPSFLYAVEWRPVACERCEGTGEFYCKCDRCMDEHMSPCRCANGRVRPPILWGLVDGNVIDRVYLRAMVEAIGSPEEIEIGVLPWPGPLTLRSGSWIGILMMTGAQPGDLEVVGAPLLGQTSTEVPK